MVPGSKQLHIPNFTGTTKPRIHRRVGIKGIKGNGFEEPNFLQWEVTQRHQRTPIASSVPQKTRTQYNIFPHQSRRHRYYL